jgi:radical SAM superfamily enzyme YgiQ (UPF0313 family)
MDKTVYSIPLQDEYLNNIKERILKKNPKTKLVLGGASKNFVDITNSIFDTYILGFADVSFINYIKYIDGKNPFFQSRKTLNGKIIVDNDVNATGFSVDNAYIDWKKEDIMFENERVPIEISRGCIFKCKFCGFALNGKNKNDYIKSKHVLHQEFTKNYDNYGITNYWFTDDTYNDNIVKMKDIHSITQSLPFDIRFRAYLRLDLLHKHRDTIDIVTESGLDFAMFGIETLNYENAKLIGKGIRPEKVFSTLEYLWKNKGWKDNVYVMAMIMLGLPHDRPDNIGWIEDMRTDKFYVDQISFNPLYISTGSADSAKSQFDREYKKYGYHFEEGASVWDWKNENFTFSEVSNIVNKFNATNPKNVTGAIQENYTALTKKEIYAIASSIYPFDQPSEKWKTQKYLYIERVKIMDIYFKRLLNL